MSEKQSLSPSMSITVNGEPREIFMSFNVLNKICYMMGDGTQIPMILQDPELRESVLLEVLAVFDSKTKLRVRPSIDEINMSPSEVNDVLEFVSNHVADFTIASMEKATRVVLKHKDRIDAIQKQSPSTATPAGQAPSVLSKQPV